jgi:two-component system, NarL family, nitrate/nitrite response regulator NarL
LAGPPAVADLVDAIVLKPADHRPSKATLTSRELDIVAAIVDGASNREIAEQFKLSPQTVKNHLSSIFDKLGVSNRLELALYAVNHRVLGERSGLR